MRRNIPLPGLVVLTLALACVAHAQQTKKVGTTTITAESMELDWSGGTNVITFTRNVKLTTGKAGEVLTAPSMKVTLNKDFKQLLNAEAAGPVTFNTLRKDSENKTQTVVCRSAGPATYSGPDQVLELTGGATADITGEDPKLERVHLTGSSLTANLKSSVITLNNDVTVDLEGEDTAHIAARKMTVELSSNRKGIVSLVAEGPVNFRSQSRGSEGKPGPKITGSAQERAVYSDSDGVVRLIGGAVADMLPAEAAPDAESMHFTGESITAQLRNHKITVNNANVQVKSQVE